jgi:N6-adenosine-specific RNA methylase IME4
MLYRTIVADPPWPIRWTGGAAWRTNGRGERHLNKRFKKPLDYPTMPVADICKMDVGALAEKDATLWLWITDRFALEGAGAAVARAWGFEPLRFLVWQKTGMGLGNCPRAAHELVLVCARGKRIFQRKDVGSVQRWKLVYENGARKHSAKPEGFIDLVETCSPGPYLEIFARRQRLGWHTWGNQCERNVDIGGVVVAPAPIAA